MIYKKNILILLMLHSGFFVYSMAGICNKMAAQYSILSSTCLLWYIIGIVCLAVYSVIWQKVLKYLPLSFAMMNKSISLVWGTVWGVLLFGEYLSLSKILGISLIIIGVILFRNNKQYGND